MTGRIIRALAALLVAAALAPVANAQQPQVAQFQIITPPIATDAAGRIEVVEFFWYECPHCYDLEPLLDRWIPKLGKDVAFRRVPATFNERWRISARVFYTLEAMGLEDKLHRPIMDAIHKDRMRITDDRQREEWLAKQGVDVAKFQAVWKSFAVESKLKRADELVRTLGKTHDRQEPLLDGVPALMINGRYLVPSKGGPQRMLDIADALIDRTRKETAAPAAAKK